ncbi:Peptidase C14, caspase catalytic [Penicillium griseofulvum]|uniref:Peptidase C14, caspase catalytic n=1 Tax=Penicillium patulum TaxID=5078 RepID=A0A135LRD8_PENPA|nr:Peptidase C14, caspase catalytic [Penicillium griseofulvum]KXG51530.1 Peptidase C14, caspase catalytic [Penicillium griseofulvum]
MLSTKHALLIASPFGDLEGPENDVEMISKVLQKRGFQAYQCCGSAATRDGIRSAWQDLISRISADDTVVIYYSGHGGEALSVKAADQDSGQPRRLQFIVPMGYKEVPGEFHGISEEELSQWLLDTTAKTQNVTVILDCCHSGRMVRDSRYVKNARRRNLPTTIYDNIAAHIQTLQEKGLLRERTLLGDNPHAVRIAAAAPWESAYEYENDSGMQLGALTEALVRVIEESDGDHISWRTVMLRVQELVNMSFPQQHPRVEGPHSRFLFSLDGRDSTSLLIKQEDNNIAIIKAGRVAGVREKNAYAVMPPGSECVNPQTQIATAVVTDASGFDAVATLTWRNGMSRLPDGGALAFLVEEALYKWPVSLIADASALQKQVEQSRLIRCSYDGEKSPLVEIRQQGGKLTVTNKYGVEIFSQRFYGKEPTPSTYKAAIDIADRVARAQHFLVQTCDSPEEHLQHDLEINLGLVEDGHHGRTINPTGEDSITENSNIFMSLKNHDDHNSVFVSVFEVEANGQINAVTENPDGVDLPPGWSHTIGSTKTKLEGLKVKWPLNISKRQPVMDTLVVVISSRPVNLQFLISSEIAARRAITNHSSLESRLLRFAQGSDRLIVTEKSISKIRYDIVQLPFLLKPLSS